MKTLLNKVFTELRMHAPFTMLGALAGIAAVWMLVRFRIPRGASEAMFWVFHPLHVYISALTTAAMFRLYVPRKLVLTLCVGYIGSIGIATLSDSLIPYIAEWILDMPHRAMHIGCISKWWLVNPLAVAGILTGFFRPITKYPHGTHVFISTTASLFHVVMALDTSPGPLGYLLIACFLFLAVWLPCCSSDIVFPLMFTGKHEASCHTRD